MNNFKNYCNETLMSLKEKFGSENEYLSKSQYENIYQDKCEDRKYIADNFRKAHENPGKDKEEITKTKSRSSYSRKNSPLKYLESQNKFDQFSKGSNSFGKLSYVNESIKANLNNKILFLNSDSEHNHDQYQESKSIKSFLGQKQNHSSFLTQYNDQVKDSTDSKDFGRESNYYNIKLLLYSKEENNSNNDDSLTYLYLPFTKDSIKASLGNDLYINHSKSYNPLNNNLSRNEESYLNVNVNELSLNYTLINRFKSIKEKENISNLKNVGKDTHLKSILKVKTQLESINTPLNSIKNDEKTKSINWESNIAHEKIFLFTEEPNANEITREEYEFIQNSLRNKCTDENVSK